MFQVGDRVSYPMHGVGVIEAIENREVLGTVSEYYVMRFINGRMTAMVPVAKAEEVGMRALIEQDECQPVIDYMGTEPDPGSDNWNQRYRDNLDKLRKGDIYSVADVVKSLIRRDSEKTLSTNERKMLMTARSVLITELSEVSGTPAAELEPIVLDI